jgi:putative transposase
MCLFFGVSRAAYYAWVRQLTHADRDGERLDWVREAFGASHQTYGYRRIRLWLHRHRNVWLNHKTVLRLMRKLGIRSIARRRKAYWSGSGATLLHRYPDLLQRDFAAVQPNQKWVTDVTYVRTQQGWAYLSTIKDLYDGFIVAHQVSSQNSLALIRRTLEQARQQVDQTAGVILHSDQGVFYCSKDYHRLTQELQAQPSMSRRGNCWDNAPMENFFSHLKEEALRHYKSLTLEQARQVIDEYIHFYNYERIQLKTKLTPYERRCQFH